MTYVLWSILNWLAVILAIFAIAISLASALADLFGSKRNAKKLFSKSVKLYLWVPSLVVLATKSLGLNNGYLPF